MPITKPTQSKRPAATRPTRRPRTPRRSDRSLDAYEELEPLAPDVRAFLAEHPQLIPALAEAPHEIKKMFPDAILSLRVERDVDLGPQPGILVMARTRVRPRDGRDRMLQLMSGWWHEIEREHDIRLAILYQ